MTELRESFDVFTRRVFARLEQGAREYGDTSINLPAPRLLDEVQQELEDVCGWSLLLWMRLERLRERAKDL